MAFREEFLQKQEYAEQVLRKYFSEEDLGKDKLSEAMRHAVFSGGKRLRPLFMLSTYEMYGGSSRIVEPFMAAIEMIHAYSLVHDDLPAMDNDTLRHGKPSTWSAYGEAMGILAGDGLLTFAFQTAASALSLQDPRVSGETITACIWILAEKAGPIGMCLGQAMDVSYTGREIPEDVLADINDKKTGALFEAAFFIGAALAGASQEECEALEKAASLFGRAFQLRDDMLDVIGEEQILGKATKSDEKNNKSNFVTRHGVEEADRRVRRLTQEAIDIVRGLSGDSEFLSELILELADRSF